MVYLGLVIWRWLCFVCFCKVSLPLFLALQRKLGRIAHVEGLKVLPRIKNLFWYGPHQFGWPPARDLVLQCQQFSFLRCFKCGIFYGSASEQHVLESRSTIWYGDERSACMVVESTLSLYQPPKNPVIYDVKRLKKSLKHSRQEKIEMFVLLSNMIAY